MNIRFCMKCGAKLEENNSVCPQCGFDYKADEQAEESITTNKNVEKSNKPINKILTIKIVTTVTILLAIILPYILILAWNGTMPADFDTAYTIITWICTALFYIALAAKIIVNFMTKNFIPAIVFTVAAAFALVIWFVPIMRSTWVPRVINNLILIAGIVLEFVLKTKKSTN